MLISGGNPHAGGQGPAAGQVQLPFSRGASAAKPSFAADQENVEPGFARTGSGISGRIFPLRSFLHPTGKAPAGSVAASSLPQPQYNLLCRWFVGLAMDDPVWDRTAFSKNQKLFLASDLAAAFFSPILAPARNAGLLSEEHFLVAGTLIDAWASLESFCPKESRRLQGRAVATRQGCGNGWIKYSAGSRPSVI